MSGRAGSGVYASVISVGGKQIALLERRWFGHKMPQGRVVALGNEVGIQARTLGPGLHFLIPFIYKATKSEFTEIKENEIGMVESVDGSPIPPGGSLQPLWRVTILFRTARNS